MKALEPAWITSRQIEACRVALSRHMKRDGKMWIRIFPDKPVTKNLLKQEWVKEKGTEFWVAVVKPGRIMFEIGGIDKKRSRSNGNCFSQAANKNKNLSTPGLRSIKGFNENEDFEIEKCPQRKSKKNY